VTKRIVASRRSIKTVTCDDYVKVLKALTDTDSSVIDDDDQKTVEVSLLLKDFGFDQLCATQQQILIERLNGKDLYDLINQDREQVAIIREHLWYTKVYSNDPNDITYNDAVTVTRDERFGAANFAKVRGGLFKQVQTIIDTLPSPIFTSTDLDAMDDLMPNSKVKARVRVKRLLNKVGLTPMPVSRTRELGDRVQQYHIQPTKLVQKYGEFIQLKEKDLRLMINVRDKEFLTLTVQRACKAASDAKTAASEAAKAYQEASKLAAALAVIVLTYGNETPEMALKRKRVERELEKIEDPAKRAKLTKWYGL
jgi:hypothetical protein